MAVALRDVVLLLLSLLTAILWAPDAGAVVATNAMCRATLLLLL